MVLIASIYECCLHVICQHMTQECLFLLMKLMLTDEALSENMGTAFIGKPARNHKLLHRGQHILVIAAMSA